MKDNVHYVKKKTYCHNPSLWHLTKVETNKGNKLRMKSMHGTAQHTFLPWVQYVFDYKGGLMPLKFQLYFLFGSWRVWGPKVCKVSKAKSCLNQESFKSSKRFQCKLQCGVLTLPKTNLVAKFMMGEIWFTHNII